MPVIDLRLDGDGVWPDLLEKGYIDIGSTLGMAPLAGGMESGEASVAFRFDLPSGETAIVQTSLAALSVAIRTIWARYGDPGAI